MNPFFYMHITHTSWNCLEANLKSTITHMGVRCHAHLVKTKPLGRAGGTVSQMDSVNQSIGCTPPHDPNTGKNHIVKQRQTQT